MYTSQRVEFVGLVSLRRQANSMGTLCLHLPSIPATSREHGSTPVVLIGVVVPDHRPLVVTPKTQKQSKTKLKTKTKTKENIRARLNQTTSVFPYIQLHEFQANTFLPGRGFLLCYKILFVVN